MSRGLSKQSWLGFCQVVTVLLLLYMAAKSLGLPVTEPNGTTLIHTDPKAQEAVAQALSMTLWDRGLRLNTPTVSRYLFEDGTSVDAISARAAKEAPYPVVALKQIVLSILSDEEPRKVAAKIQVVLQGNGYLNSKLDVQPDPAFAAGDIVILYSDAFRDSTGSGYAILVRKNAFRLKGPRPVKAHIWF